MDPAGAQERLNMETLRRARTFVRESLLPVWADGARWRSSAGARWLAILAVVSALAVPVVVLSLRPSPAQAARLGFCLAISGLTSIALAVGARWLTDRARMESVRVQLGAPLVLTALVIAVNVVLLARLLFFSRQDVQLLLAFVAFGIAVALTLSSPIAGRITRAVARLERGAGRIAAGEYAFRIVEEEPGAAKDLTHLTHLINQMATGLEEAFQGRQAAEAQRRRVVMAVSHDLRTPVSSIHAMVEAIADGIVTDPATLDRYHQTLLTEIWHLTALMEELFELTRLESGAFVLQREQAHMEDLITDALEATRERAEQVHIHLGCQVDGALPTLSMDAKRIARVLDSLLRNAVRYTCPGGTVLVRAGMLPSSDGNEDVLVQVIDTGAGIAAGDLPLIFEPTYRAEASRKRQWPPAGMTSADPEAGLGLAIAARIIEVHGGRIWAVSPLPLDIRVQVALADGCSDAPSALSGTMLSFTLPVTCPPEAANTRPALPRHRTPAA
jgi:signal transduction histidine kinase